MAGSADVLVRFITDTSQVSRAASDVEGAGGRMKGTFKGVGAVVGGALAVGAVVAFGKASVTAAQESEVATNRLQAVFKAMGDETGNAAREAEAYAGALSKQIGVEDEVIMQGQAILATFRAVSNETARQAGIFDRATAAAADLAAAGFGSLETNSVQLGKALQDPVKGINALARSGVTFTAAQKEMIASLIASGDQLGAQKVILKAVEDQVKGTAAATATEAAKTSVAFGEMQEAIGMAFLPIIQQLTPALVATANALASLGPMLGPLAAGIIAAAIALKVLTVAQIAFGVALSATGVGAIIVGIGLLIAALILLAANWDTVTAAITAAMDKIKQAALRVFDWIKANWPLLLLILAGPVGVAAALIIAHWDRIQSAISAAVSAIRSAVTSAWNAILSTVTSVGAAINAAITSAFNAAKAAAQAFASYLTGAFNSAINTAKAGLSALGSAADAIVSAFNSAAGAVRGLIDAIKSIPSRISLPSLPNIPGIGRAAPASGPMAMPQAGAFTRAAGVSPALMQRSSAAGISVRVFIGDTELKGLVRTVVAASDTQLARTLLAGAR